MQLTIRKKSFNQLGASAVEYALTLAVITTLVMAGANKMGVSLEETMVCAGKRIKAIAGGGEAQCGGGGKKGGSENTAKTDQEKLQEILENYQVDESPIITYVPEVISVDFDDYSRQITEAEKVFIDQLNALQLYTLSEIGESSFNIANEFYPKPENWEHRNQDWTNDGHNDAFRHIYLNILMTREFGAEWTEGLATAHESVPGNDSQREAMDLYNNELGRRIARDNPFATETELQQLVRDGIARGDAVVIDAAGDLQFSDTVSLGEHRVPQEIN